MHCRYTRLTKLVMQRSRDKTSIGGGGASLKAFELPEDAGSTSKFLIVPRRFVETVYHLENEHVVGKKMGFKGDSKQM